MELLLGIFCFLIILFGIGFQFFICEKYDEEPSEIFNEIYFEKNFFSKRMIVPTFFASFLAGAAALIFFGTLTYNTLSGIDPNSDVKIALDFKATAFLVVLALIIVIKSYLAPFLVFLTASWTLYIWVSYGSVEWIPVYQLVIDYIIPWAPEWAKNTYLYTMMSYVIGATAYHSLADV